MSDVRLRRSPALARYLSILRNVTRNPENPWGDQKLNWALQAYQEESLAEERFLQGFRTAYLKSGY